MCILVKQKEKCYILININEYGIVNLYTKIQHASVK